MCPPLTGRSPSPRAAVPVRWPGAQAGSPGTLSKGPLLGSSPRQSRRLRWKKARAPGSRVPGKLTEQCVRAPCPEPALGTAGHHWAPPPSTHQRPLFRKKYDVSSSRVHCILNYSSRSHPLARGIRFFGVLVSLQGCKKHIYFSIFFLSWKSLVGAELRHTGTYCRRTRTAPTPSPSPRVRQTLRIPPAIIILMCKMTLC